MKVCHVALGSFAGFVFAQGTSAAVPPAYEAVDQCSQSALNSCPADITSDHRCLKIARPSDGELVNQCVFSCSADSPCLSACGRGAGNPWCGKSGECYCDWSWDSAQAAPANPEDLSWVKRWAAVGDSYAAGIGSGELWPDSEKACARYDQSYPAYIQSHELMPQDPPAVFAFHACSGATAPEVLDKQVAGMATGYDVITVSAGGNDAGLSSVLNACVFQWNPFASCSKALQKSRDLIRDVLPGNLDRLYQGLGEKISPGRKVYVTGYATFFAASTKLCDDVTWSFWYNFNDKEHLTSERRTQMNELVQATNAAIEAAVKRAGDAFEYVGYDGYFSVLQGRFCEEGVREPDVDRNGLLFFERGTKEDDLTMLGRREVDGPEPPAAQEARGRGPLGLPGWLHRRAGQVWASLRRGWGIARALSLKGRQDGGTGELPAVSFGQYIEDAIKEARDKNPDLEVARPDHSGADPAFQARSALKLSNFVGDDVKRVFHPRPAGHAVIAGLVVWRMTQGSVAARNSPTNATEVAGCAVPALSALQVGGA